jgi:hypothetical protein
VGAIGRSFSCAGRVEADLGLSAELGRFLMMERMFWNIVSLKAVKEAVGVREDVRKRSNIEN